MRSLIALFVFGGAVLAAEPPAVKTALRPFEARTLAPGFTLAVQWHPEMRVADSSLAHAIFAAFGEACRARRARRLAA